MSRRWTSAIALKTSDVVAARGTVVNYIPTTEYVKRGRTVVKAPVVIKGSAWCAWGGCREAYCSHRLADPPPLLLRAARLRRPRLEEVPGRAVLVIRAERRDLVHVRIEHPEGGRVEAAAW